MENTEPLRALVTDDHASIRRYIRNILEKLNYHVTEATDGQEAVNIFLKIADQKFDLLTMDYQMPRLNGAEAILRIRQKNKEVPIICISSSISLMRPQIQHAGRLFYLEKPFDPEQLKSLIRTIQENSEEND